MGKTHLPGVGMALLRSIEVGDPQRGSVAIENVLDDPAVTTASDDMEDDIVVLKHPIPPFAAVDPHAGFVRINHP